MMFSEISIWDWLTDSHLVMVALLAGFALVHSGLAAWRSRGEQWLGARGYRLLFAAVSIPLALLLIVYFINHRYDGVQLWQLQDIGWIRPLVWILSAISFVFLYPATFNLLEIAAVQKPQVHLYETGIIRICRHPQMVGQIIWCVAHTLWLGSSFAAVTSLGLIAHHLFGVWHGDRRWQQRYPEAFPQVKARTSIVPFLAIWQGRQSLKLEEFLRPAYLGVVLFVWLLSWAHPYLIQGSAWLGWR
jgi:uncharacterized membrane protein